MKLRKENKSTESLDTQKTKTVAVSKQLLFFGGCVIALVGFVAGTRDQQWQSLLGPIVGLHTSSKTLDLSSVENTYQHLVANFDGKLDSQALIDGANHGLVKAAGDKFTVYFDKKEAKEFNNDLSGDVGAGIGAQIGERNGQPVITKVLDDNPAGKVGLKAGDIITKVNDESAVGWSSSRAASKIRGQKDTTVQLTISRSGQSHTYMITRAQINNPSVTGEVHSGIGIMTISRFDDQTGALARQAAESFKRQNVHGVVIDLRSDGGGYLDAAADVAGLWLDDKLVVTQKRNGKETDQKRTHSDTVLKGIKTVILVNDGTASASEILSSALRDHGAAMLVGETTYGKGSVQELLDLDSNGALLKVTVAKWYTPNGVNVNGNGLKPDVIVKMTAKDINAGHDPQLAAAKKILQ